MVLRPPVTKPARPPAPEPPAAAPFRSQLPSGDELARATELNRRFGAQLDALVGPARRRAVVAYFARVPRYRPNLEDVLLMWASRHFREAFEAFAARADAAWEAKCLASIVRRRASLPGGNEWLMAVACSPWGGELAKLGPHVKRAGGYPVDPAAMTFAQWVGSVRGCEGVAA